MLSLRWRPIEKGIEAFLPQADTDGAAMTARITMWWSEVPTPSAGIRLEIECDFGPVCTFECFDVETMSDGLARLGDSWRSVLARGKCALAAWEACP